MPYPRFIQAFPAPETPFPEDIVSIRAIRSDAGLVVFFDFLQDFEIPQHAHKGQWGFVVSGEAELTIGGETRVYRTGDSYSIGEGVMHGGRIRAGTRIVDVFEEPDRYRVKP